MEGLILNPILGSVPFPEQEICLHRWKVNENEVKLVRKADQLFHEIVPSEGPSIRGELPFPRQLSIDKVVEIVSRQEVYFLDHETIGFCEPVARVDLGTFTLTLLKNLKGPIWQLFDKNTKTTCWQNFSATFASSDCHKETWDLFEILKETTTNQTLESFSEDFLIKKIIRVSEPFGAEQESQVIGPSEYDLNKRIEKVDEAAKKRNKLSTKQNPGYVDVYEARIKAITRKLLKYQNPITTEELVVYSVKEGNKTIPKQVFRWKGTKGLFAVYAVNNCFEGKVLEEDLKNPGFTYQSYKCVAERRKRYEFIDQEGGRSEKKLLANSDHLSREVEEIVKKISPFFILVEPMTYPSYFDPSVRVSKFRWAVTLICYQGFSGQHSELITEGISDGSLENTEKGQPFIYVSHLISENYIEAKAIDPKKLKYDERTEIWVKPANLVQKMLADIAKERDAKNTKFSIFGSDSFFSDGADNCCTWARKKLKIIGVELKWTFGGLIATETKSFTRKPAYYIANPVHIKI